MYIVNHDAGAVYSAVALAIASFQYRRGGVALMLVSLWRAVGEDWAAHEKRERELKRRMREMVWQQALSPVCHALLARRRARLWSNGFPPTSGKPS